MNDLVDILLRYHAYNASNLDGGNSSALVIDNKIVNHPINWDNLEQTRPIPCGFIVKEINKYSFLIKYKNVVVTFKKMI